jgi:hypothetical protein
VTAFVAGSGAKSAAEQAAKMKGIEKILYVENSAYDRVRRRNAILVCLAYCFAMWGYPDLLTILRAPQN